MLYNLNLGPPSNKDKIIVFLPILASFLMIPLLILGAGGVVDLRSRAAERTACTVSDPCRGLVQFSQRPNPNNSYYYLDEDGGAKYKLGPPAKNNIFAQYVSKRVVVTGSIVPKVSKKGVHYKAIRVETIILDQSDPSSGSGAMDGDDGDPGTSPTQPPSQDAPYGPIILIKNATVSVNGTSGVKISFDTVPVTKWSSYTNGTSIAAIVYGNASGSGFEFNPGRIPSSAACNKWQQIGLTCMFDNNPSTHHEFLLDNLATGEYFFSFGVEPANPPPYTYGDSGLGEFNIPLTRWVANTFTREECLNNPSLPVCQPQYDPNERFDCTCTSNSGECWTPQDASGNYSGQYKTCEECYQAKNCPPPLWQ